VYLTLARGRSDRWQQCAWVAIRVNSKKSESAGQFSLFSPVANTLANGRPALPAQSASGMSAHPPFVLVAGPPLSTWIASNNRPQRFTASRTALVEPQTIALTREEGLTGRESCSGRPMRRLTRDAYDEVWAPERRWRAPLDSPFIPFHVPSIHREVDILLIQQPGPPLQLCR
jgi:hypothetical protein